MQSESDNGSSLLSARLETFIEDWDQDAEPQPDEEDPKETSALIQRMIRLATSSLEGFSESAAHKLITLWGENPEYWRSSVDEFYSRETVGNIRKSVSRFLKLREVPAGTIPSSEVNVYLREATRCYIYGFAQASVALCRAALRLASTNC